MHRIFMKISLSDAMGMVAFLGEGYRKNTASLRHSFTLQLTRPSLLSHWQLVFG